VFPIHRLGWSSRLATDIVKSSLFSCVETGFDGLGGIIGDWWLGGSGWGFSAIKDGSNIIKDSFPMPCVGTCIFTSVF
jgi:hypothetical protein